MLYYHLINNDYLIFRGSERLDLINRLSTNQVDKLHEYQGLKTVLTSDKGRFIDLLTLYSFHDFVFTACSYGHAEKVKTHLDKYTIMDDFQCENMANTHEAILFFGKDVDRFVSVELDFDITNAKNNDFKIIRGNKDDIIAARNDDAFGGTVLIYPLETKDEFNKKYLSSDITERYSLKMMNEISFNTLRVEYGIPAIGTEMNDETNPLECGLNKYVSFTKGCYIGQEVIARLDTYDKISKHLTGIKFENANEIETNGNKLIITDDNKECGNITSTAISTKFGKIGLGFIKTAFLNYNKKYFVKEENKISNCKITKLPF